jgi:hypothetical protein
MSNELIFPLLALPPITKPIKRVWSGFPINPAPGEDGVFVTVEFMDGTGQEFWDGQPLWVEGMLFGHPDRDGPAEFDPDFYTITQII